MCTKDCRLTRLRLYDIIDLRENEILQKITKRKPIVFEKKKKKKKQKQFISKWEWRSATRFVWLRVNLAIYNSLDHIVISIRNDLTPLFVLL